MRSQSVVLTADVFKCDSQGVPFVGVSPFAKKGTYLVLTPFFNKLVKRHQTQAGDTVIWRGVAKHHMLRHTW